MKRRQSEPATSKYPLVRHFARSGDPVWSWKNQFLQSRFDPKKEALAFVEKQILDQVPLVFLIGLGGYYHIITLLNANKRIRVYCLEPEPALEQALALEEEYRRLDQNERFLRIQKNQIPKILQQYQGAKSLFLTLPQCRRSQPQEVQSLEAVYQNRKQLDDINTSTVKKFFPIWVKNLIQNTQESIKGILPFYNRYPGTRILVLGAGPSLEELNFQNLRDNYHIIIAVDTANRILAHKGVQVDFWISGDAQYWNLRHLDNLPKPTKGVILDIMAPPASARFYPELTHFATTGNPISSFLAQQLGKLRSGGSVSTMAWDFARYLGAKEIHVAGLDLGFPMGQTHARGALFQELVQQSTNKYQPVDFFNWRSIHAPGTYHTQDFSGNPLISDQRMDVYRKWFEYVLSDPNSPETLALSSASSKIHGMRYSGTETLPMPQKPYKAQVDIGDQERSKLHPKTESIGRDTLNIISKIESILKEILSDQGALLKIRKSMDAEVRQILTMILPSLFASWAENFPPDSLEGYYDDIQRIQSSVAKALASISLP